MPRRKKPSNNQLETEPPVAPRLKKADSPNVTKQWLPDEIEIGIKLPRKLFDAVDQELMKRGTNIETFVRLQFRAFSKGSKILSLRAKMPFGKYVGEPVEDVCRADPGYMNWIISNSTSVTFDVDVLALLEQLEEAIKE